MADDINNNEGMDEAGDAGMPDDLKRLLARAEQGEDGDPDSYNPDAEDEEEEDDDAELEESFGALDRGASAYKGLGEMDPKQLASTTMDPKTRILQRVSIEDAVVADRAVRELMGSEVGYRREYIEKHAHDARFLDA